MTDTPTAAAVVVTASPAARNIMERWVAPLGLLLAASTPIATFVFGVGDVRGDVKAQERRIEQLEVRAKDADAETRDLGRKLERVDGKLDLLIERTPARS